MSRMTLSFWPDTGRVALSLPVVRSDLGAGGGKIRGLDLKMLNLRCLLDIQVGMSAFQLDI